MPKRPEPITVTTGNGATITVTPTSSGIRVEVGKGFRIAPATFRPDRIKYIYFDVESPVATRELSDAS